MCEAIGFFEEMKVGKIKPNSYEHFYSYEHFDDNENCLFMKYINIYSPFCYNEIEEVLGWLDTWSSNEIKKMEMSLKRKNKCIK